MKQPSDSSWRPHARLILDLVPGDHKDQFWAIVRQQTGFTKLNDVYSEELRVPVTIEEEARIGHLVELWLEAAFADINRRFHSSGAAADSPELPFGLPIE